MGAVTELCITPSSRMFFSIFSTAEAVKAHLKPDISAGVKVKGHHVYPYSNSRHHTYKLIEPELLTPPSFF